MTVRYPGSHRSFTVAHQMISARFRTYATKIHTKKWQGLTVEHRPDMVTYELLNETFCVDLFGIESLEHWRKDIKPNVPWADDHFEERVCGAPLNPGTQWANWPWASSADKHRENQVFNHTYMERLWPRHAGLRNNMGSVIPIVSVAQFDDLRATHVLEARRGIYHEYGDLGTLVEKLAWEPDTRQAYVPLYFPEDTGAAGRMPCTLGYQFIMRDNKLHLYYPLRSCDFVRHWADDCYLAVRLLLWMLDQCRSRNEADWRNVQPGTYTMHATSLHVFANDAIQMGIGK